MKTPGIPVWTTVVLALIIALSIVSSSLAITGNGLEDYMGGAWGGRNIGLAIVAAIAIWLKNPVAYIAAFAGGIARDAGDIIEQFQADEVGWPLVGFAAVLIGVWVFGILAANKARVAAAGA